MMQLTEQQVLALAPDSGSAANGKKLAQAKNWPTLGRSGRALWGECQGSGKNPYQVRLDLADFASKCSCPSFKFPCKHALGLLLLTASQPALVADASEPDWVSEWLDKRSDAAAKKEAKAQARAEAEVDPVAQQKRLEKRDNRVRDGLTALQVWLEDLVRNGLARLPAEGPAIWEQQAARLIDAQAPGLANRLRSLADLPGTGADWPERLSGEIGKIALALHGFERLDSLPGPLQASLRQHIGFNLKEEEVLANGEVIRDQWQVIGQWIEESDKVRTQRTWLYGLQTRRFAMQLQFAAGLGQSFGTVLPAGTALDAELVFWPGAGSHRAMIKGSAAPLPPPQQSWQAEPISALLNRYAQALAINPWQDRLAGTIAEASPVRHESQWFLRDAQGDSLPLIGGDYWLWLALTGGSSHDIAVEWDGRYLRPLGAYINQVYEPLTERRHA
ncbi:SWIM zinc finger family protein [Parachitinimonas caeni]|uniref:SWIM zinc finger domain-containing protein n=1 Tax=Parachitinimonas caeni TaxID=3031301 RepID=A0ABT7E1H7_9NEIS|nr:SWIM zinc finger family protein [Parachitinimonas caeni]MDK2125183.1 SWIM zinc finger domain-containing protein [Parachitinimonas caeni]